MKVRDILARKGSAFHIIRVNQSVRDAVAELVRWEVGALLVLDETDDLCGILSERDVLRLLDRIASGELGEIPLEEIMTRDVVSAASDDSIESVMQVMTEGRFRHLPIIDDREIVGILSMRDVVEALANDLEYENQVLKEYVMGLR